MVRQVLSRSTASLVTVTLSTVAQAGLLTLTSDAVVPNGVVVTYDPADGNLSYDGNGVLITVMEIVSSNGMFGEFSDLNPDAFNVPGDPLFSGKYIKLDFEGMARMDIGSILPPGLSADFLLSDLQVDGSLMPSGKLDSAPGGGPYLYIVPEPSTSLVALLGLALAANGLRSRPT